MAGGKTVKNFMVSFADYPCINQNESLERAVNILCALAGEKGYRWLTALDDEGNISGFLTLRMVLESISNINSKPGKWLGFLGGACHGPSGGAGLEHIKNAPVKKYMRPLTQISVRETDSPVQAAEIIINCRISILPVRDKRNKIVGIVRPVDILPFINDLFNDAPVNPPPGTKEESFLGRLAWPTPGCSPVTA
ncbi:hypothetical protein DCCM_2635 [Desulfocucumis palustris]|uniref:CBS domain-containing protein n=1 Tax=Desulfocucumis palustris TaxID=1898651 RepID=A0A2L2XCU1_9FIRM|nr:CBS domain-containing protein [Desulfocucumis palustris]GBF33533.1 hypothetical protein DCCM_2635 [Desulfocucumis palustris]